MAGAAGVGRAGLGLSWVELDGVPLSGLDPGELRTAILVASHDARLFDGTVRANLTASPDADLLAEERAAFVVADVSPVRAARSITVPVLLIHGTQDDATPPDHSQRVLAALGGPKRLVLVEGARHNESLRDPGAWIEIERWIDALVGS